MVFEAEMAEISLITYPQKQTIPPLAEITKCSIEAICSWS